MGKGNCAFNFLLHLFKYIVKVKKKCIKVVVLKEVDDIEQFTFINLQIKSIVTKDSKKKLTYFHFKMSKWMHELISSFHIFLPFR